MNWSAGGRPDVTMLMASPQPCRLARRHPCLLFHPA
nr:MAG TPA: hypothetical protein [Caudoviricetes sp.]